MTNEEVDEFSKQLSSIIDYVEKIKELDTDSAPPAEYIAEIKNVFREDSVRPSLPADEFARLAPDFRDGHIVVPKIIE
ncbi:MAG: Asp-tRNA(Asn)/Glu-tRNA(Gln) amidotransferase subunit GatC [Leptospirales bacterium]|nr:Asp-tRNA(Asn)/Glu-tRNA(Gln) amidotransferase subunit GatC [Leptospirales bacterium]